MNTATEEATESLARVLRANGFFSLASGVVIVAAAWPLADVTEVPVGLLVAVGAGLLPYGAGLVAAARRPAIVAAAARFATVADLAWVAGAAVVIVVPGAMSVAGKGLLAAVSVVVARFAIAQFRLRG